MLKISSGRFTTEMAFIDWNGEIGTVLVSEHIVNAIDEVFNSTIISDDEISTVEVITINNKET